MITEKEIEHLAKLARLGLSLKEKEKLAPEFERILDFVGELSEVDTKDIEPLTGGTDLLNIVRSDKARPQDVSPEELILLSPQKEGKYFKVPRILQ
ncbi:MAG: Asp-tRNA(Asn)/Glu-tRNA(Gln) amidotransferase subunit GatC [Candidatus Paceibacteria bacterium]